MIGLLLSLSGAVFTVRCFPRQDDAADIQVGMQASFRIARSLMCSSGIVRNISVFDWTACVFPAAETANIRDILVAHVL